MHKLSTHLYRCAERSYTTGFARALNRIVGDLASPSATLTVALYIYAKEQGESEVAFAITAILMVLLLLINPAVAFGQKHFEKRRSL